MPVSRTFRICNSYESGVGHGLKKDGKESPYPFQAPHLNEAWRIGYNAGTEMADEKAAKEMREYEKHEFCKAMRCSYLKNGVCMLKPGCCNSARGFHGWLTENGFRIVKAEKDLL